MAETGPQDDQYKRLHEFNFKDNQKFLQGWKLIYKDTREAPKLRDVLMKAQVFFYSRDQEQVDLEEYKSWLKTHGLSANNDLLAVDSTLENTSTTLVNEKSVTIAQNIQDDSSVNRKTTQNDHESVAGDSESDIDPQNMKTQNDIKSASSETRDVDSQNGGTENGNKASQSETKSDLQLNQEETQCDLDPDTAAPVSTVEGQYPTNFGELVQMLQNGLSLPGIDDTVVEASQEIPAVSTLERKLKPWECD